MSTFNKLNPRARSAREQRHAALAFFRQQAKLPGAAGVIAQMMHNTLRKIHKDPTLNGPAKEAAFKHVIQQVGAAQRVSAVQDVRAADVRGGGALVADAEAAPPPQSAK